MKLIIQIPCFNEAETLPITLAALPRTVPGFSVVEWLIVDDGSQDETSEIAKRHGVDHIIKHPKNLGLARAFMTGMSACISQGADVIVNTDADNQYCADDIPALTAPITEGLAEIVVGARPISQIEHFSFLKKTLQRLGSWVVRKVSKTDIPDAPSGFRAFSRNAAKRLIVFGRYTYTIETIIQAGQQNLAITSVPIRVNGDLRPSRLISSVPSYLKRSAGTVIRIFVIYRPFAFFGWISFTLFTVGSILILRFLWYFSNGSGQGHVQSLIFASILLISAFQALLVAFIAELLGANRKLLEEVRFRISDD